MATKPSPVSKLKDAERALNQALRKVNVAYDVAETQGYSSFLPSIDVLANAIANAIEDAGDIVDSLTASQ